MLSGGPGSPSEGSGGGTLRRAELGSLAEGSEPSSAQSDCRVRQSVDPRTFSELTGRGSRHSTYRSLRRNCKEQSRPSVMALADCRRSWPERPPWRETSV